MTPLQLAARIRSLRETVPITTEFERALTRREIWSKNRAWYTTQKEHWLGWLSEYRGSGYYGRKNFHRSAQFAYNHIVCPPMVLWLAEASGVAKVKVAEAKGAALSAKTLQAQSAAIRRIIPWEMIEDRLDERGRYGKKSSTRSEQGKKTARTRKLRANEQAGKTRRIHWVVESDELDNLGHGVQFLHDETQREKPDELRSQYPVAFLEGFNWREGSSATVRLLGSRPTFITADHWPEIIESTREAVLAFLSNEGEVNWQFRHGPVYVLANA